MYVVKFQNTGTMKKTLHISRQKNKSHKKIQNQNGLLNSNTGKSPKFGKKIISKLKFFTQQISQV